MRKLLLSFIVLFFGTLACYAQNVYDISVAQQGNKIAVSYSIDKAAGHIELTVSLDGGMSFSTPLQAVYGDVYNVQPGRRTIVWHVLEEWEKLEGDNIVFQVGAENLDYVDLGLSVKWAKCNLGAYRPEEYGRHFAWGDLSGQIWNGSNWSNGEFSDSPTYELDQYGNLKREYDAAFVTLGGPWRMPTRAEWNELFDNCTSSWTSNFNGTGVAGRIFVSKKPGYAGKFIFLPAAGNGYKFEYQHVASSGYYWSSTFFSSYAWYRFFYSDTSNTDYCSRYYGFSIRPVRN